MHISPMGVERLKDSPSSACERTRPAASPYNAGSPWGAQQVQRIRVAVEEIGMLAQIGDDVASADLGRPHGRRQTAAQRLRLVLRTIGHAYFRGAPPRRRPKQNTAAGRCAIIRKPP